jgi:hypothetical protein
VRALLAAVDARAAALASPPADKQQQQQQQQQQTLTSVHVDACLPRLCSSSSSSSSSNSSSIREFNCKALADIDFSALNQKQVLLTCDV